MAVMENKGQKQKSLLDIQAEVLGVDVSSVGQKLADSQCVRCGQETALKMDDGRFLCAECQDKLK